MEISCIVVSTAHFSIATEYNTLYVSLINWFTLSVSAALCVGQKRTFLVFVCFSFFLIKIVFYLFLRWSILLLPRHPLISLAFWFIDLLPATQNEAKKNWKSRKTPMQFLRFTHINCTIISHVVSLVGWWREKKSILHTFYGVAIVWKGTSGIKKKAKEEFLYFDFLIVVIWIFSLRRRGKWNGMKVSYVRESSTWAKIRPKKLIFY